MKFIGLLVFLAFAAPATSRAEDRVPTPAPPGRLVGVMLSSEQALFWDGARSRYLLAELGEPLFGGQLVELAASYAVLERAGRREVLPLSPAPEARVASTRPRRMPALIVRARPEEASPVASAVSADPAGAAPGGLTPSAPSAPAPVAPAARAAGHPVPVEVTGAAWQPAPSSPVTTPPASEVALSEPPTLVDAPPAPAETAPPAALPSPPSAAPPASSLDEESDRPAPVSEPPRTAPDPTLPRSGPASRARAPSFATLVISRTELDRELGDFTALSQDVQIAAAPRGFRLLQVRPGSFVARIGLRPEDVLLRLDGHRIRNVDDAARAYAKLRVASGFSVEILRHGRPVTLHYAIAPALTAAAP